MQKTDVAHLNRAISEISCYLVAENKMDPKIIEKLKASNFPFTCKSRDTN